MRFRQWLLVLSLTATAYCGDYQVVLKDSGKVIHGDLLAEDANTATLQIGNSEVSFKKERLNLERMRELNGATRAASVGPTARPELPPKETGLAALRNLERQIPEREATLARLQAQPPSDERDRKIRAAEEELRVMRHSREELKAEYGVSPDPELARLLKLRSDAFAEAEEAQREYDSLPPGTPQSEVDTKWERFQAAEKKWQDAQAALQQAMKEKGTTADPE